MLICMRTTLNIDDRLGRAARLRAAEEGTTLTALIERALRRELSGADAGESRIPLPVVTGDGLAPGVDLADNRALLELMDPPGSG